LNAWERRLADLAHLLGTCAQTYFEPDLFRMNVNQFLQTSRTVTFIIQKNKAQIPGFDPWYAANVEAPWRADTLMTWAKDSRNKIEKQGDLELHSTLRTTLLFSYLREEDIFIECGRAEVADANVKRLVRIAQKKLPTGVADAAAVKIERRWVTASLPEWELLHALTCVYSNAYAACAKLAEHLGTAIDPAVPPGRRFSQTREVARQVRYVKLRELRTVRLAFETTPGDDDFVPPKEFLSVIEDARDRGSIGKSLLEAVQHYATLAKISFEHFGSHVPIAFVFDSNWLLLDMLSANFEDQTDKYIFWRAVAERISTLNAYGMIWIAESWERQMKGYEDLPARKMPIVGERLHVVGFDKSGAIEQIAWSIKRQTPEAQPTLVADAARDKLDQQSMPFFFVPSMRALGLAGPRVALKPSNAA